MKTKDNGVTTHKKRAKNEKEWRQQTACEGRRRRWKKKTVRWELTNASRRKRKERNCETAATTMTATMKQDFQIGTWARRNLHCASIFEWKRRVLCIRQITTEANVVVDDWVSGSAVRTYSSARSRPEHENIEWNWKKTTKKRKMKTKCTNLVFTLQPNTTYQLRTSSSGWIFHFSPAFWRSIVFVATTTSIPSLFT